MSEKDNGFSKLPNGDKEGLKIQNGFSKDLNKLMQFPSEGVFSTVLAKSETYNYTLMCLAKGTDIDTHTSTKNGVVQVLKGKGTFKLFDKEIVMEPGKFIFMPKDAPHALKADEDLAILLCLTT
jgi:quercetin dioxygenase-like cupin family protein